MSEREHRPRRRGKASGQQDAPPPATDESSQTSRGSAGNRNAGNRSASNRSATGRSEQRPAHRPPATRPAARPASRKAEPAEKAPKGYYLPDFDDLDDLDDLDLGMDEDLEPDEAPAPQQAAKKPQQQRKPQQQKQQPPKQNAQGRQQQPKPQAVQPQPAKPQQAKPQQPKPQQAGQAQPAKPQKAKQEPVKEQPARQQQPAKQQQGRQAAPAQAQEKQSAQQQRPARRPEAQPQAKQPPVKPEPPKPAHPKQPERAAPPQAKAQPPKTPPAKQAEKRATERPVTEVSPAAKQPPRKGEPRPPRPPRRAEAVAEPVVEPVEETAAPAPVQPEAKRQRVREPRPTADEPKRAKPPAARPARTEPNGFAKLGVSKVMLEALDAAGYLEPTPVQEGLIPRALEGIDVMGQARTGTGKTAAFAIPILEKIEPHGRGAMPQALVLVPTRELAVQVRDECGKLALGREVRIAAVYGGKPIRKQAEELHRGVDFVVGTPGRVIDMTNRGLLDFRDVRYVVLDEADRMLDIGFRPDIEKILRRCPESRQTLLLSATIAPPIKRLAERYMREPEMLDFSVNDLAVETIEQHYFSVDPERKFDLLIKLLEREEPRQAIIFCRTKRGTERLHRRLSERFSGADTIHGDLAQSARDRVMARFREGRVRYLVATDVVGRGIDVSGISHIINFDIPAFCDDYVHRVGRTGRMGREGVAFTFVTPEEGNELTRIEMRINILLKRDEIPGFSSLAKPQPTGDLDEPTGEEAPPAEPKPVYGKVTKRYRRAL